MRAVRFAVNFKKYQQLEKTRKKRSKVKQPLYDLNKIFHVTLNQQICFIEDKRTNYF